MSGGPGSTYYDRPAEASATPEVDALRAKLAMLPRRQRRALLAEAKRAEKRARKAGAK